MTLLYNNGLPFNELLALTLDEAKHRVIELNKSVFISVDGAIGSGKSTDAVHIADYLNGAYARQEDGTYKQIPENLIDLDIKSHVQYSLGSGEFIKKLSLCYQQKKNVLIYDESGDFSKRGSLTKLNSDLNRIFEVCRALKIIVIFVMPNIFYIDRSLFDKEMIRFHIRISRQTNAYSDFKLWNGDCINWIKYYSLKLPIPNQCYNYVKPSYKGHFLPLSEERADQLKVVCNKFKLDTIKEMEVQPKTPAKGLTLKDIQAQYNVSNATAWAFVKKHNIKFIVGGKSNYYDEKAVRKFAKTYGVNTVAVDNASNLKGRV